MNQGKKTRRLCVAYVPMSRQQGKALTHYACKSGTRGYLTLRLGQPEKAEKTWKNVSGAGVDYAPAMT